MRIENRTPGLQGLCSETVDSTLFPVDRTLSKKKK